PRTALTPRGGLRARAGGGPRPRNALGGGPGLPRRPLLPLLGAGRVLAEPHPAARAAARLAVGSLFGGLPADRPAAHPPRNGLRPAPGLAPDVPGREPRLRPHRPRFPHRAVRELPPGARAHRGRDAPRPRDRGRPRPARQAGAAIGTTRRGPGNRLSLPRRGAGVRVDVN